MKPAFLLLVVCLPGMCQNTPSEAQELRDRPLKTPEFLKDPVFHYDVEGTWKVFRKGIAPEAAPAGNQVDLTVDEDGGVHMQKGPVRTWQGWKILTVYEGEIQDSRIVGKMLVNPDGDKGDPAWEDMNFVAEDGDHLVSDRFGMMRVSVKLGANEICDPGNVKKVPKLSASIYAKRDYELGNVGNAACWFYIAGMQGDSQAQAMLGEMLHQGQGVRRDYDQAFLWALLSAGLQDIDGERLLALFYGLGHGIARNPRMMEHFAAQAQEQQNVQTVLAGALGILSAAMSAPVSRAELVQSYTREGYSETEAQDRATADENERESERAMWQRIMSPPVVTSKPPQ